MKLTIWRSIRSTCAFLSVLAWLAVPTDLRAAQEQVFDVLKVGAQTYRNVTVTTKSKGYVFITHAAGMTNLKISELPPDVLTQLGYEDPRAPKVATNGPAVWAKQTLAKLDTPEVKAVPEELKKTWNNSFAGSQLPLPEITREMLLIAAGVLLVGFLFHSFCCMLICKKAGSPPGFLVWIPGLQLLPLLKAARISRWWFLVACIPGPNIILHIVWCFKICEARGKTAFVAVLLLFPVTSIFAFLYLALSNVTPSGKAGRPSGKRVELMTLETA